MEQVKLQSHEIALIAANALVSPKSVKKYFNGELIRGMTRARIERALDEMKLSPTGRKVAVTA